MDAETLQSFIPVIRYIVAALTMVLTLGATTAICIIGKTAIEAIGRNPDAAGAIQINMILAIAFSEAIGIYILVVAIMILIL